MWALVLAVVMLFSCSALAERPDFSSFTQLMPTAPVAAPAEAPPKRPAVTAPTATSCPGGVCAVQSGVQWERIGREGWPDDGQYHSIVVDGRRYWDNGAGIWMPEEWMRANVWSTARSQPQSQRVRWRPFSRLFGRR